MLNLLSCKYYAPPDTGGGEPAEGNEETLELLSEEDIEPKDEPLDLKGEKAVKEEDDEEEKDTEEDESETDAEKELKELEEELKPKDEEDLLELTTPVRRKEILAKYPKLFKDFPYLEKAYYREQQYTELLPTVADARIAVEKARVLDATEQQVMSGDIGGVLAAVRQEDQEAFHKIADNYLPTLRQVDEQAYYNVLGNVIKDTIITMVKEGRSLGENGAPLTAAANILNQFVFGSQQFQPPRNLSRQVDRAAQTREQQYQQEDQQRAFQQFESVRDDLQTRADNVLKSTIDSHIDPNGSMTDYVKGHAVREAFNTLENLISQDTRFRALLDKLWARAYENGFDKASNDKIKAAYLSKAKTLLPTVLKKARQDALRGNSRRVREDEELTPKKSPVIQSGRSTTPSSGKIRKASDIPKGMSTLDFLNDK